MRNLLFSTKAPRATILIRLLVGAVLLSEGIQKFLHNSDNHRYQRCHNHDQDSHVFYGRLLEHGA